MPFCGRTYLTAASKDFFGYSIEEYGNADAMVKAVFDAFDIFNQKVTVKDSAKEGYKTVCTYFETALAKVCEQLPTSHFLVSPPSPPMFPLLCRI
jgi:hypothetical protein